MLSRLKATRTAGLEVENDVLIGRNGTLFIFQGGHKLYEQAQGKHPLTAEARDAFAQNLRSRRALCAERGIGFAHLFPPDKQVTVAEDYPLRDVYSIGAAVREQLDAPFIWGGDMLTRSDFHRTDSHWNIHGQFKMMPPLLHELGLDDLLPEVLGWRDGLAERKFTGDLGVKLSAQPSEIASVLPPNPDTTRYGNGLKPAGNEGTIEVVLNRKPLVRRTLLVFGTSSTQV
ncbi:hypothetical protein [Roseivivax jejudonensis]|uniref:hypothetical protein n=1 Tax=Roseivivax jejudonensis TaxID=1529041 RepID=UPI00117B4C9D|nr:hypothetical protein [Roseivivax jejudonensis]